MPLIYCSSNGRVNQARDGALIWKMSMRFGRRHDPAFRGDAHRYNPEELLLASLASCHMLWYLHLCAVNGINVLDYHDEAHGAARSSA